MYWPQTKNLTQDVLVVTTTQLQLRLQLEKYLAQDCLYQRHIHKTNAKATARLEHDPSVNQTAESYFMTKSNKTQNAVKEKTGNSLKTIVQTISKHQQA